MSPRRKNQIRWAIVVVGFLISAIVFAPGEVNIDLDKIKAHDQLRDPDPGFPIPTPRPREEGIQLFSKPFLFEMADSDKFKGIERESRLHERYEDLLDTLDGNHVPQVSVSSNLGSAMVMIDDKPFVTVLPQDCPEYFSRLSPESQIKLEEEVAYSWGRLIQEDLVLQTLKREPNYLSLYNYLSLLGFWLACAAHLTLSWVSNRFVKKPLWSVKLLVWVLYFTIVTDLHPSLDELANVLSRGALSPIFNFILIGVGVGLLHQATHFVINRYLDALADYDRAQTLRAALRRQTLEQAWTFVSKIGWMFLGLCLFLREMGVDLTGFFAGAGLIGVAIGILARDIFLDFVNGAYILVEDQFGVGDWIEANSDTGEVVGFSLRATKVRRGDGSLATIPNSDLRRVKNHSNEYSMVDFKVTVAYATDSDYALALIMDEVALLDTEWQDKIVAPPDPLGVQELGPAGVIVRVRIKTVPLAQWEMHRRLNRAVKRRFDQEGIIFAGSRNTAEVTLVRQARKSGEEPRKRKDRDIHASSEIAP